MNIGEQVAPKAVFPNWAWRRHGDVEVERPQNKFSKVRIKPPL
jgi:hypothetical protein